MRRGYRVVKRLMDIVGALAGLVILSPLLALIALLVRVRLGAPVLFRQQRPGLGGKPFTLLKFRTMTDARDVSGQLLPNAERLTPVGAWLRRLSLDEIPGLHKPYTAPTTTRMSWFVYVIRCADGVDRNALMAFLEARGVPSRPYFTPIHLQPFYRERFGWARGDLPHTEKAGDTFLALPFSSVMAEAQVEYVCAQLREGVRALA